MLVLDTSGSMEGVKLAQTKTAAADVLARLGPDDRFGIVAFASHVRLFDVALRPAADAAVGSAFTDGLTAGGATNIGRALEQGFRLATGERPTTIVFLTDGVRGQNSTRAAHRVDLRPSEVKRIAHAALSPPRGQDAPSGREPPMLMKADITNSAVVDDWLTDIARPRTALAHRA